MRKLGARLRGELQKVAAAEPEYERRPTRAQALGAVAGLYFIGWGAGTYAAFATLTHGYRDQATHDASPIQAVLVETSEALAVVALALIAIRWVTGSWEALRPATSGRQRWVTEVTAGAWWFTLAGLSIAAATEVPGHHEFPHATTTAGQARGVVADLAAGPTEELAVLVAPLLLLRAARIPWGWTLAILAVIRVLFHAFYGPGSVLLVIWAIGMVAVYLRTRAAAGIIVAHLLFDVTVTPTSFGADWLMYATKGPLTALATALVFAEIYRWWVCGRGQTAPDDASAGGR